MKCRNCGTEYSGSYCPKCGSRLTVNSDIYNKHINRHLEMILISVFISAILIILIVLPPAIYRINRNSEHTSYAAEHRSKASITYDKDSK